MDNDSQYLTSLNYELLVEDALRTVVRAALRIAESSGLPGDSHFYISFRTDVHGVTLESDLARRHPEVMTVVIQHQYDSLVVAEDSFSITLFFGGKPARITVPFDAVTTFNDPSVGFSLQFDTCDNDDGVESNTANAAQGAPSPSSAKAGPAGRIDDVAASEAAAASDAVAGEVVQLDAFRKQPS